MWKHSSSLLAPCSPKDMAPKHGAVEFRSNPEDSMHIFYAYSVAVIIVFPLTSWYVKREA